MIGGESVLQKTNSLVDGKVILTILNAKRKGDGIYAKRNKSKISSR